MSLGVGVSKSFLPAVLETKSAAFDHDTKTPIENFQVGQYDGYVTPVNAFRELSVGPFEFIIPASDDSYLMMNTMYLYVKAAVMKGRDGTTPLDPGEAVAPCNLFSGALWEEVEVKVNDEVINPASTPHANYKAYLETVLSYDQTAKDSLLRNQLFSLDTPGAYNNFTMQTEEESAPNQGFHDRSVIVRESQVFDIAGPIQCDLLRANNHLCPGNKLTLRLKRAQNRFLFMSATNHQYKLAIKELRLFYRRLMVRPDAPLPNPQRYLITRTVLKTFPQPLNITSAELQIHTGGIMPSSVVIAQVKATAIDGNYHQNPFYFRHFNLGSLYLRVNGHMVPATPLEFDFSQMPGLLARSYLHLFQNTGAYGSRRGNLVSLTAYNAGMTIVPINLDYDLCNGYHIHAGREGNIVLHMKWDEPLEDAITVLVHMSFNEELQKSADDASFTMIQH